MVTKEKKSQVVAELTQKLQDSVSYYILDFGGISAAQSVEIRREFREVKAEFKVAKNTLIKIALEQSGKSGIIPDSVFAGHSALVIGYDDPISPAKVIKKLASVKDSKISMKAAVIEGQFFDGPQMDAVAELPNRETLIAGILGSINAPASGIVGAINAVMRDVAYLVEEVAKKKAA
jgi:large subunit ribosomal protein L10